MRHSPHDVLMSFSRVLPTDSCRNYGTAIGQREGMIAITDGFKLLVYHNKAVTGTKTYRRNLEESSVKFPKFENILPTSEGYVLTLLQIEALKSILYSLKKTKPPKNLFLNVSDEVTLGAWNPDETVLKLNPFLPLEYLTAMPKQYKLDSVTIHKEEKVASIEFRAKGIANYYQLILVAVTGNA